MQCIIDSFVKKIFLKKPDKHYRDWETKVVKNTYKLVNLYFKAWHIKIVSFLSVMLNDHIKHAVGLVF